MNQGWPDDELYPPRAAATRAPLDPRLPVLPDNPPEWSPVPPELLERLAPGALGMRGVYTPEQLRQLNQLARARWFLIRLDGDFRCKRCKRRHPYLTTGCVERPLNGLQEVLLAERRVREQTVAGRRVQTISFQGFKVGQIVPITERKAQELLGRIRAKGYSV